MAQTYTDKYGTIHAGRPHAQIESLRVISGHIRVKRAKSRMVKVGSKEFVV